MSLRYLVFSAHPDDADVLCAGTLARLCSEGNTVSSCVLTDGGMGTHNVSEPPESMTKRRESEQRSAARSLGIEGCDVYFLGLRDGKLEHTVETRSAVVRMIRKVKPDIVISLDPANREFDNFALFHRDHRATAEIVFDACYPDAGSSAFLCQDESGEDLPPHNVGEIWFYGTHKPDHFVNVEAYKDQKRAVLRAHASQFANQDETAARVDARAEQIGALANMPYAECFRRLVR